MGNASCSDKGAVNVKTKPGTSVSQCNDCLPSRSHQDAKQQVSVPEKKSANSATPGDCLEDERTLRSEIEYVAQQIREKLEAIATLQKQIQTHSPGAAKSVKSDAPVVKDAAPKDTSRMSSKQLQEELERLEEICETLKTHEQDLYKQQLQVCGGKLHQSPNDRLKKGAEKAKAVGRVGSARASGSGAASAMTPEDTANLEDPRALLGKESEYGLRWEWKYVDDTPGPRDEHHRRKTREGTKRKVAQELGLNHFGDAAAEVTKLPPNAGKTTVFLDQSQQVNGGSACAGGTNLLGRYDVACVRATADLDKGWNFIKEKKPDFWVAHAAALNIGESLQATDFVDFSLLVNDANPNAAHVRLDEEKYFSGMEKIVGNIVHACTALKVEHLIFFPFGMGAFLRHLGQLDINYFDDEAMQRLRRRLARSFISRLAQAPAGVTIHICLQFTDEEPQRNADAFIRALVDPAASKLKSRVRVWAQGDSLQVAHELAAKSKNVMLVNGANRQLLGNHWFAGRAKMAIDENLHRRSWTLAALSYLLNNFDGSEPSGRSVDELKRNVERIGGRVSVIKK